MHSSYWRAITLKGGECTVKRFILGVVAGIAATLLGGFILCEVAEHCDLPLEVPEK